MSILCSNCGYSITELTCASCVINEIQIWLYEQKIKTLIVKKIDQEFRHLAFQIESLDYALFPSSDLWDLPVMECLRCKKEMHVMCSYCVTHQASEIVKNNLKNKKSIETFNESFNTSAYDYELD